MAPFKPRVSVMNIENEGENELIESGNMEKYNKNADHPHYSSGNVTSIYLKTAKFLNLNQSRVSNFI